MFKDDKNHETQYCKNCLELTKQLEYRNKENKKLKQALDEIEKFMIYEFSGQNQWVKKNVLDIINKAKGE